MSTREIGQRVGAVRNTDEQTAYLFGYGTYQGEEVPPDDVPGPFGRLGLLGVRNPKMVMDDGTVVWGCESWWGSEEKVSESIGSRRVEIVKPERTPPTEAERAEIAEIVRASMETAESVMAEMKMERTGAPREAENSVDPLVG